MKLISEEINQIEFITEGSGDQKNLFIEGIFMQSNIRNKNGRIYPESVLENAIKKYSETEISQKRAYGELNHPSGPNINLDRAAILINSLQKEGTDWIGKAKVLSTPMGSIVKGIVSDGGVLGVSSRALGSLKPTKDGIMEVQSDLVLCTAADVVSNPSAPNAYVKGIMEGTEWIFDEKLGWRAMEIVEDQKKFFHTNYKKLDEEKTLEMFQKFLNSIIH